MVVSLKNLGDKLDYFILLIPAFISILFPLIFESYLFLIFPGLVLGWLLPVYIGYWRGSIKLESTLEKTRGIVYLWNGLLAYAFLALLVAVTLPFSIENPFDELILFIIVFGAIPVFLWPKIKSGLLEVVEEDVREKATETLTKTMQAGEALNLSLYGFTILIYALQSYGESGLESTAGQITTILIFVASIALFVTFWKKERKARGD